MPPLDYVDDAEIPHSQAVEDHSVVPTAVLDVRSRPRTEWIALEFPKMRHDSVAMPDFEGPQEGERFVGKKELKLR